MPAKQLDSNPVTMAEAKKILEERKKEGGELAYEQKQAYEHLQAVVKLSPEKAKEMVNELKNLGLNQATSVKITDILPITVEQLKQILTMENRPFEEEQINEIIKIVDKYRGK